MEISSTQPTALRNICNFGLYELHCSVNLSDVNTVLYRVLTLNAESMFIVLPVDPNYLAEPTRFA